MPTGRYKRTKEQKEHRNAAFKQTMAAKKAAGWVRGDKKADKLESQPDPTEFPLALIPDRVPKKVILKTPMDRIHLALELLRTINNILK